VDKLEHLHIPLPGGAPDFQAPITVEHSGIHAASLYFSWEQQTVGFGQCTLHLDPDTGAIRADTEGMSAEWLRRALHALVDTLVDEAQVE
jgi:hypothetical protein